MKSPAMKSPIWTIFRKEVLENLRDRKTVMNALIVGPLLGPVLFAVMISTVLTREMGRADKPLELPVIGAEQARTSSPSSPRATSRSRRRRKIRSPRSRRRTRKSSCASARTMRSPGATANRPKSN